MNPSEQSESLKKDRWRLAIAGIFLFVPAAVFWVIEVRGFAFCLLAGGSTLIAAAVALPNRALEWLKQHPLLL